MSVLQSTSFWVDGDPVAFQLWQPRVTLKNVLPSYKLQYDPDESLGSSMVGIRYEGHLEELEAQKFQSIFYLSYDSHVLNKTWKILFPFYDKAIVQCPVLLVANLAHPGWILVPCTEKFLFDEHIFCTQEKPNLQYHSGDQINPVKEMCPLQCIVMRGHCFEFKWHIPGQSLGDRTQATGDEVILLLEMLSATMSGTLPAVFIHSSQHAELSDDTSHRYRYADEWYDIFKDDPTQIVFNGNSYHCGSKRYISIVFMCDGFNDCSEHNSSDEMQCDTSSINSNFSAPSHMSTCSNLFHRNKEGKCVIFSEFNFTNQSKNLSTPLLDNMFTCDGQSFAILNDLTADCGQCGEDEPNLLVMSEENATFTCPEPHLFPCRKGHSRCFLIYEICSFKLSRLDKLVPCTTGEHLQNCTHFECNGKFKCPKYYCLPWSYVCDGKWDCPQGKDESVTRCARLRLCTGLFQCARSSICVHFHEVCDEEKTCPYGDDEYLCALLNAECPPKCECLSVALRCYNVSVFHTHTTESLPYSVLWITQCNAHLTQMLLTWAQYGTLVYALSNNLTDVCGKLDLRKTVLINLGNNRMESIKSHCFSSASKLRHIHLQNNSISQIEANSFDTLVNLLYINLAYNHLQNIHFTMIRNSSRLWALNLLGNTFTSWETFGVMTFHVDHIITEHYQICCSFQDSVKCPNKPLWPNSCSGVLGHTSIKVTFYCLSAIVFVANVLCCVLQRTTISKGRGSNSGQAFGTILISINIAHFLPTFYLSLIWIADIFYRKHFIIHESEWQSHPACFLVFGLKIIFVVLSSNGICFMSFARLMVVTNPMKTHFKSKTFVMKCLYVLTSLTVAIALVFVVTKHMLHSNIYLNICSPFVDTQDRVKFTEAVVGLCVTFQMFSILFVPSVYLLLMNQLLQSKNKMKAAASRETSFLATFAQIFILSLGNMICWGVTCSVLIISVVSPEYPIRLVVWTTISVPSITSVVNPLIFIAVAIRSTSI